MCFNEHGQTVCCGTQAFVYKYYGQRNARQFAPHALREAVPGERVGAVSGGFLQLQGLGKIAYSNVRRPKPLMDVSAETVEVCQTAQPQLREPLRLSVESAFVDALLCCSLLQHAKCMQVCLGIVLHHFISAYRAPEASLAGPRSASGVRHLQGSQGEDGEAGAGGGPRQAQRPLEQEPLLAARIMIEDCMNLLLDVEDIDRLYTAGLPGTPLRTPVYAFELRTSSCF